MTNYFKYTNGEAFLLNGQDYKGFFHVKDGYGYTKKIHSDLSEKLTPKKNFLSNFYLKKLEFDNQLQFIEQITPNFSNTFDIINKNELTKLFESIDYNNLVIFKSLVIQRPEIINFDENNCHYYGLSSSPVDMRNDDTMITKNVISQIDPYEYSPEWEFMNNITHGSLFVSSDESFKYLCTTGLRLFIVKGSVEVGSFLTYEEIKLADFEEVYNIHYDQPNGRISIVVNNEIRIYRAKNFIECDELILIDIINLGDIESNILTWGLQKEFSQTFGRFRSRFYNDDSNNSEDLRFGNNLRIVNNLDQINIYNKYSNTKINALSNKKYNINNILSVSIRTDDDLIGILHQNDSKYYLSFFDPYNIDTTFKTHEISNLSDSKKYNIYFSDVDSNILHINTENQHQIRFISNPTHAPGQMKNFNLKYPDALIFGDAFEKFRDSITKWNTSTLSSNNYKNIGVSIFTVKNRRYILLNNSGRLYYLKQSLSDMYLKSFPIDATKEYEQISCGDNSFGLSFNKNIERILKDTLTLYTKSNNSFIFEKNDTILSKIKEINYSIENLYFNGNESVNIITTQRILSLINDIQEDLKCKCRFTCTA